MDMPAEVWSALVERVGIVAASRAGLRCDPDELYHAGTRACPGCERIFYISNTTAQALRENGWANPMAQLHPNFGQCPSYVALPVRAPFHVLSPLSAFSPLSPIVLLQPHSLKEALLAAMSDMEKVGQADTSLRRSEEFVHGWKVVGERRGSVQWHIYALRPADAGKSQSFGIRRRGL